jgi:hypothetical protein
MVGRTVQWSITRVCCNEHEHVRGESRLLVPRKGRTRNARRRHLNNYLVAAGAHVFQQQSKRNDALQPKPQNICHTICSSEI